MMQDYFGSGTIRPDRSDRTLKWEVRSLPVIVAKVIPHFEMYPLLSGKQRDFEAFADVCWWMTRGEHLLPGGLTKIVWRIREMNPSGKRGYKSEYILARIAEMKA
jgi:LAGLIDADG endonuclease